MSFAALELNKYKQSGSNRDKENVENLKFDPLKFDPLKYINLEISITNLLIGLEKAIHSKP